MSTLAVDDPILDAFAREVGTEDPIAVEGGRTRWRDGGPPSAHVRLVTAPTGMVAYTPDEMTVTVRAGMTVSDLHGELANANQRTALPERGGTVGGAFAVGENDVHMLGRGRLRTAALQVRYISAEGRLVTGGGPTVKNVSGFDLPRLMVGSLGTLGMLAEFIVRTNPIPPVSRWLRSDDVDPFAVQDTVLRPSAILWDGATTWVQLEGHESAVDAESAKLITMGSFTETSVEPALRRHRWSLAPAELRGLTADNTGGFLASIGVGTVWAGLAQDIPAMSPAVQDLSARLKNEFDPTGRLNPGRSPGARV